jgi:hypothetical protein
MTPEQIKEDTRSTLQTGSVCHEGVGVIAKGQRCIALTPHDVPRLRRLADELEQMSPGEEAADAKPLGSPATEPA